MRMRMRMRAEPLVMNRKGIGSQEAKKIQEGNAEHSTEATAPETESPHPEAHWNWATLTATLRRFALRSSASEAPFAFRLASILVWIVSVTAGALPSAAARDLRRRREDSMASRVPCRNPRPGDSNRQRGETRVDGCFFVPLVAGGRARYRALERRWLLE